MTKKTVGILFSIVGSIVGGIAGIATCGTISHKLILENSKRVNKFKTYYEVLNQWLILKQEGKKLESYFINAGYENIAIYGMGVIGNRLYEELKNSEIKIRYCLDKEIVCSEDEIKPVDVIIVTAMFAFDEIEDELREKVNCPIISFEEVIFLI